MSLSPTRLGVLLRPHATLEVFVPGALVNPLNGSLSRAHWSVKRKWATTWKEKTRAAILASDVFFNLTAMSNQRRQDDAVVKLLESHRPKRITFTLLTPRGFDTDAWGACVKPVRDALIGYVIQDDGPRAGHEFHYEQVITRRRRGVLIGISPLEKEM